MSLNQTPSSERIHISFFGKINAGKSSLLNALTNQDLCVVSDVRGTTTDPVQKTMELLPLGPVVLIDTPGVDDDGELGALRVEKTKQILRKTDVAVFVVDATTGTDEVDLEWLDKLRKQGIPTILVWNKMDMVSVKPALDTDVAQVCVSVYERTGVEELLQRIVELAGKKNETQKMIGDLIKPMDVVVLVVPIDESAPKGRLILPQQMAVREILDAGGIALVVKDTEYSRIYEELQRKPDMVITDSQVFKKVNDATPRDVALTSFSILMARKKGFLKMAVEGVQTLDTLQDGDLVLIAEGCTHHRQCGDIGSVKLPKWISEYTGKELQFCFCSGTDYPIDVSGYKLVIHCGGCMLNENEMKHRRMQTHRQTVPFTNYGIAIAYMNCILDRSLQALQDV
ncbi:MAG: [FeFe] hydrogenase H-cluster maturation GTPase HydF [Lachnospiraceae bacterium]|nr:[FeFe] hydrogenase H-cluster maturation GTPase HydF [Lachnospiraceae bacterium]